MKYLKYLFLLPVVVNLAGQLLENPVMTGVSKPFLMPLIALSIFLVAKERDVRDRRVKTIILALLFGMLGDIFLMIPGAGWFLVGMLAFLIGHIFYFSTLPAPWKVKGVTGKILSYLLLLALLAGVLTLVSRFPLKGPMRIAVLVYACAFAFLIHACIVAAIDRKKPVYFLTALGFAIFAFSDILVATGVFTDIRIPRRGFIVMSTYIAAQLIVSLSLLAEEIHELNDTEYGVRVRRLYALEDALKSHESEFVEAFRKDFGKGEFETYTTETGFLYSDIHHILNHLRDWMEPRAVPTPFVLWPARSRIFPEPYGKVLVIGPFNYPLHLVIAPLAAALAAGNTVVVKPSRQTPNVSSAVTGMLRGAFSPDVVEVLNDSVPNEEMLSGKYDYIFFTGSPRVGKIVMEAASRHLTPVTLELGGKSPAIVCADANVRLACERIAKGKFLNAGQTCVAPDYLLVRRELKEPLLVEMQRVLKEFYGEDALNSPDYPRIVNRTHYERLNALLTSGRLAAGGEKAPEELFIAPTILDDVKPDDPIMENEIFGPILPVLAYNRTEEAIAFINERPKPLALYCFGNRRSCRAILGATSSGSACVNDCVMQLCNPYMPFGGVGASGMGCYHGDYGFACFSHLKPVMVQRNFFDAPLRYPPFREWKQRLVAFFCR